VDQRDQTDFIMKRSESLVTMGYLPRPPRRELMDWSLLERAIAANRALWESLERRTVPA
jgi:NitT/TauT family transport system substrate-binding protein